MRLPFSISSVRLPREQPTRNDFTTALTKSAPLSVSVFTYGLAYGALAHSTNHLGLVQSLAMSVFVFAGASQFTILALLKQGTAFWAIVSSVFLLNSRQILYGLSLGQYLTKVKHGALPFLSHGLTDESYSVSILTAKEQELSSSFFAGAGTAIFVPWLISSALGYLIGSMIADPAKFGLDFAYTAAFMGLLGAQITSSMRLLTVALAGLAAAAAAHWYGTSGAVFAGAVVSFMVGVMEK
ncbi:AzlC family ABC transporter permease [Alicyclobacillus ferrooxydans]|uniref:AzlC family ABC transporter permease n=1 Tax=Alicyclobacillus ferrooxydans TaxID=471514 RepID=UPI000A9E5BE8|nr:AzlC family ABC transporter permease [Alicyclobacillus ferrooxydans]